MCLVMDTLVREKAARRRAEGESTNSYVLQTSPYDDSGVKPPFPKPLARASCLANINAALVAAFSEAACSAAAMPKPTPIWEGKPRAAARFFLEVFDSLVAKRVHSRAESTLRWFGSILARYGRGLSAASIRAPHRYVANLDVLSTVFHFVRILLTF